MKYFLLFFFLPVFVFSSELKSALQEDRQSYLKYFQSAADEFVIPVDVLKGISFAETRWSHLTWASGDTASCMGMPHPYGIMSLWDNDFFGHNLREAAQLIGKDVQVLKDDPMQNIRGAAALLKKLYDSIPIPEETNRGEIESWRNAIAAYSSLPRKDFAQQHALDIFSEMNSGYHKYGISWNAHPVKIEQVKKAVSKIFSEETAKRILLRKSNEALSQPDYPLAKWVPSYPGHWYTSGYSHSFVVIHDMEGYYLSTILYFQQEYQPSAPSTASVYYCINGKKDNSSDAPAGEITQMVEEKYWAWHVVCWNRYMFGIEHEGFVSNPAWYTEEMYAASSKLTAYLCDKYGIPKDRNHIIGHDEHLNPTWVSWLKSNWPAIDPTCNSHTDPGQYWDWNHYMALVTSSDTIPPSVVSSFPIGNIDIPCYKDIRVAFNTSMDVASTNVAFSISPTVAGTKSWNGDNTVLTFHPTSFLSFGTTYTVKIDTSAKNISTKINLGNVPFQFTFTTVPTDTSGPVIVNTYPLNHDVDVSTKTDVVLTMDEPVQQSSLATTVKFYDSDNATLPLSNAKNDTLNDRSIISFSSSNIKPNSTYTVKLLPGIKDYYGNSTTDTMILQFTTSLEVFTQGIVIDPFETNSHGWLQPKDSPDSKMIDINVTTFTLVSEKKLNGTYSGKLSYLFTGDSGGTVVEQISAIPSIDSYNTIGMWVAGDQSSNEFQVRFTPDNQIIHLGPITWRGWKFLEIPLNEITGTGKKINACIVHQVKTAAPGGVIYFDDMQLNAAISQVGSHSSTMLDGYTLYQNYPNPFNPTTTIQFSIGNTGNVSLKIFNVLGEEVASLVNEWKSSGAYSIGFDASRYPSGVYFYTLRSGNFVETQKMVLMK